VDAFLEQNRAAPQGQANEQTVENGASDHAPANDDNDSLAEVFAADSDDIEYKF